MNRQVFVTPVGQGEGENQPCHWLIVDGEARTLVHYWRVDPFEGDLCSCGERPYVPIDEGEEA